MRAHDNQVAAVLGNPLNWFFPGFSKREFAFGRNACGSKLRTNSVDVRAVCSDLFAGRIGPECPRGPFAGPA